jgi:DNA/RNA-binding domain of Phe-tRNA-synthetase-like protein
MTEARTRWTAAELDDFLAGASIDDAVTALRPDYRALLIAVDGITPANSDRAGDRAGDRPGDRAPDKAGEGASEDLKTRAEAAAQEVLAAGLVEDVPHVASWREAYRAFGAKPQRTRNSLEALMRRAGAAGSGLPRVNALTDIYNAISVLHQVPLGGEDLSAYAGPPRLLRATGSEPFDTVADGEPVIEHPEVGEVVWCDHAGVTCRRWNGRQGRRTQLTPRTTSALFILDSLEPMTDDALTAAGEELLAHLRQLGDTVTAATRLLTPNHTTTTNVPASAPVSVPAQEYP